MSARNNDTYDVVGIGFGPSNLSLAISLEEHHANVLTNPVTSAFFERQPQFGWHRNMLLPSATMQISFLKDLVTFRNPVSRFSFVSFLHAQGRLAQFVNRKDFFPTRQEFHQYLEWAESSMTNVVTYNSSVTAIRRPPPGAEAPDCVQIEVRDTTDGSTRRVNAHNVVISTGLEPRMPDGVVRGERVWHSSEFLAQYHRAQPAQLKSVAVVGAGQSAAEITKFFHTQLPHAQVHAVFPSYGYSIADDTPFANQIFDAAAVDDYYYGDDPTREAFWRYHRNTNYGVVDNADIRALYQIAYDEDVSHTKRLHFHNQTKVKSVTADGHTARVLLERLDGAQRELGVDAIVFATGYATMDPTHLLGDLDRYCLRDESGHHRVTRDYRLVTTPELTCGIYLQGGTEHTHGLTSSLLSNIAVRSGEIADAVIKGRTERELAAAAAQVLQTADKSA
ncbi:lysine N(6)-hydroxylase/L-ornithine N(5)-oxygenase family protein [Streptomyces resistomycificus]|uniref:L-lysine N6-monooxygenase MbtG n=1 Tax=Streptomyces resistomycificus TaxID=67356 RepID=A0A0L8L3C2_9ACTN|nr:SidA/IucD/PvdA family monooxygenase [Streptomyces resistomycificus]KOG32620.1 L-lysine 6-monooxygenase [Streptomyces resistomycificus]KUN90559.1 L-lysine 6-monooxygenase [Streptomyces resistomycificus]